jgi:hypothetical protein
MQKSHVGVQTEFSKIKKTKNEILEKGLDG